MRQLTPQKTVSVRAICGPTKTTAMRIMASVLCLLYFTTVHAQLKHTDALFLTLKTHDSLFFEKCFNTCDSAFANRAVHKDLIFFHDRSGISNKTQFMQAVAKNLCSDWNNKPVRKVRPETLEVYPLYNNETLYGVVQQGVHDFYIRRPGQQDTLTGTAKFVHVYLLEQGEWILKEVLSFDHK